jgi:hypothetical protein
LARLNALGREGAALQVLAHPLPETLQGVYELMLNECQRRMPAARQQIALKLLHWLAFSRRVLTLDEVTSLLVYLSKDDNFSLEEIPEVAAKFLQIGDPALDAESRSGRRNGYITSLEDVEKADSTSNSPDDDYNDGSLPVKFKERSMRAFFRDAASLNSDWCFTVSEANRQILLDSVNLVKPEPLGPGHTINESLRLYSAYWLLSHFCDVKLDEHTPQQKAEVMEGFAMALSHTDYAETLSRTGMNYNRSIKGVVNDKAALWAANLKIEEVSCLLTPSTASWWADVATDARNCRLGMAKGYARLIYTAADVGAALTVYKLLYGLLGVVSFHLFVYCSPSSLSNDAQSRLDSMTSLPIKLKQISRKMPKWPKLRLRPLAITKTLNLRPRKSLAKRRAH